MSETALEQLKKEMGLNIKLASAIPREKETKQQYMDQMITYPEDFFEKLGYQILPHDENPKMVGFINMGTLEKIFTIPLDRSSYAPMTYNPPKENLTIIN